MTSTDTIAIPVCLACGLAYDPTLGLPEFGIPAGTAWADVPADFKCPECGVGKSGFELL